MSAQNADAMNDYRMSRTTLLEFFVPGPPVAKQRARTVTRSKGGVLPFARTYTPAKTMHYEAWVRESALRAYGEGRESLDAPLSLDIDVLLLPPASWSFKRQEQAIEGDLAATKKPDLDNIIKAIKDSLNKVVWRDDSLIVELRARKRYSRIVGVNVRIEEASGRCAP